MIVERKEQGYKNYLVKPPLMNLLRAIKLCKHPANTHCVKATWM